jgi:hypothetical protein
MLSKTTFFVIVHRKVAKIAKGYLFSFPQRGWKAEKADSGRLFF